MPFEVGNKVGKQFARGTSGNPTGRRPGCTNLSTRAVQEVMAVAERVLTEPESLKAWETTLRATWRDDPWRVWRWLVQVMPRESISITRDEATGLASMTVKQLRSIAGIDDGQISSLSSPADSTPIDVEPEDAA